MTDQHDGSILSASQKSPSDSCSFARIKGKSEEVQFGPGHDCGWLTAYPEVVGGVYLDRVRLADKPFVIHVPKDGTSSSG